MLSQFKGHVSELARHPYGADVLVDLYDVASTQQRNALCAEFYGRCATRQGRHASAQRHESSAVRLDLIWVDPAQSHCVL